MTLAKTRAFLHRGTRLEQFETWQESSAMMMTAEERTFLEASLVRRDELHQIEQERLARKQHWKSAHVMFCVLWSGLWA